MENKDIKVEKLIGIRCITAEDGDCLYREMIQALKDNKRVTVDFTGVIRYASPFFNNSYGRIIGHKKFRNIDQYIYTYNLDEIGMDLKNRVQMNAKYYYSSPVKKWIYRIYRVTKIRLAIWVDEVKRKWEKQK